MKHRFDLGGDISAEGAIIVPTRQLAMKAVADSHSDFPPMLVMDWPVEGLAAGL
jgi:hypothetical protein